MILTKHGFDSSICNVEHLDAIFDLIKGKWRVDKIGWRVYFIYDDDIFTSELKNHQSFLSKKFWSYKNYNIQDKIFKACSVSEFKILLEEYKQQQQELEKKKEEDRQKKIEKKINADRGIYGIYCDNELIYIGKTDVDFETRFRQHKYAVESGSISQYLYKYLVMMKDKGSVITLKPLINIKDLKVKGIIRNRDIEAMELALIQLYQPICNIQGIKQDYEFTY